MPRERKVRKLLLSPPLVPNGDGGVSDVARAIRRLIEVHVRAALEVNGARVGSVIAEPWRLAEIQACEADVACALRKAGVGRR